MGVLKLDKEFYTADEVAELLRVSVVTIYRAVKEGHLTAHKVGRVQRFHRGDIEAYLSKLRGDT